jgi:uncharacterized protein YjbI with pentapeptide repeats
VTLPADEPASHAAGPESDTSAPGGHARPTRYKAMTFLRSPDPIDPTLWQTTLAQHAEFLLSGGAGGSWTTLVTTADTEVGTVFGVYLGAKGTAGAQAKFSHARLEGVDLRGVDLSFADLCGVGCVSQDLSGAILRGCLATDSDFSGSRFTDAMLAGADFSRSEMIGCDFRGADLTGADLEKADLTRADFRGATLRGARFPGALLDDARFD